MIYKLNSDMSEYVRPQVNAKGSIKAFRSCSPSLRWTCDCSGLLARQIPRNRALSWLDLGATRTESSGGASRVACVNRRLLSLQVCASLTYGCVPYDANTFSCAYADKRVWRLRPPLRPCAGPWLRQPPARGAGI
jgi:hypothetical protein